MTVVTVPNETPAFHFRKREPIRAWAEPGDLIEFVTTDASYESLTGLQIDTGAIDFQRVNTLVGPVGIRGARPGDALGVEIVSIEPGARAFTVYVAHWRSRMFGPEDSLVVEMPIVDGFAELPGGGRIRAVPTIGCIGVAPASGAVSSLAPASPTGGNMDLVELTAGATIWLPVQIEGAALSLGDLHVRMGRGETTGSGFECGGRVVVRTSIQPSRPLTGPVIVDERSVSFVGTHADDHGEAERVAVRAAWDLLTIDCDVPREKATAICAGLLDLNMGGPAGANMVASFEIAALAEAEVSIDRWPVKHDGTVLTGTAALVVFRNRSSSGNPGRA